LREHEELLMTTNEFKKELIKLQKAFNKCQEQVNKIDEEVSTVNNMDPS